MTFKKSYLSTALLLTLAQTSYAEQTYELADVDVDANASKTATGEVVAYRQRVNLVAKQP
ncbi:hypothetical protein [Campylobacter mucosalis]|uniref:hypothetical protein n=1 Tax=Campylobacter mucosalis TaxID=202 RepID=UPI00146FED2D|nr:hypothetical protein [Campylobacter mucosalis]